MMIVQQYLVPLRRRVPKPMKQAYRDMKAYFKSRLRAMTVAPTQEFPIPFWFERSFCEPSVQIALRDICRPGQTVFDVGANAGGLSLIMSRLVGPKGLVCSFEASPRIVDKTNFNLTSNGCSNVFLVHRAVFRESNRVLKLYPGADLNDSLVNVAEGAGNPVEVKTVSLDDFCEHYELVPSLIKFDIEGAEFDAVQGAKKLIEQHHPHLILENPGLACSTFLFELGYECVDLATYRKVTDPNDSLLNEGISNVLFYSPKRADEVPFLKRGAFIDVNQIDGKSFNRLSPVTIASNSWVSLAPGRYLFEFEYVSEREDNDVLVGVETPSERLSYYRSNTRFLGRFYRKLLIDLDVPAETRPFFEFLYGTQDPTLKIFGVKIRRLEGLSALCPGLS